MLVYWLLQISPTRMPNDRWKICRLFYRSSTKESDNHYWVENTDFLIIILFCVDI